MADNNIDKNNDTSAITKHDITKSMWIYYMGAELSNSYERLQSLIFCASMIPILKKLYKTKESLSQALKRHLIFFNTEGTLGTAIQGIVIAMEEENAQKKEGGNAIIGIKTGLMGPLAGMGDAIIWAAIMPIIIAIFIPLAKDGSPWGGILPLIIYTAVTIAISYSLIHSGYTVGKKSILDMLKGDKMKSIIFVANVIGLFMIGALSANYVKISTPMVFAIGEGSKIVLQDILNKILPGLLPLTAVYCIYWYLSNKGPYYTRILITVVLFSLIASILGIL